VIVAVRMAVVLVRGGVRVSQGCLLGRRT
jgi:hypothetical protein